MVLMEMGVQPCAGKMLSTSMPFYSWLWEARACPTIGLGTEPSSQNQCQHAAHQPWGRAGNILCLVHDETQRG